MVNQEKIELLKQYFKNEADNSHERAIFVGAGASVFLDIKSWEQLLKDMNDFFKASIPVEEKIFEIGYPKMASLIYNGNKTGEETSEAYKNFMENQFNPRTCHHYSLHTKIWTVFDLILTTNFDIAFESALSDLNDFLFSMGNSKKKLETQKLPDFDFSKIKSDATLVYLHGHKETGAYVFRKEEYDLHYQSLLTSTSSRSDLERFLENVFRKITLLFIGFSFNDSYFIKFFKRTIKDFEIQKSNFEKVHGQRYPSELPLYMAILHEKSLQTHAMKSEVEEIFNDDKSWHDLFEDHNEDKLLFKQDTLKIVDGLSIDMKTKRKIRYYYNKIEENKRRRIDLEELNMEIIVVDDYNCTEDILNLLKMEESGIVDEEDAKYATVL